MIARGYINDQNMIDYTLYVAKYAPLYKLLNAARIAIRGKLASLKIYELLAENITQLSFDLKAYQEIFEQGFKAYEQQHWNEAINHFEDSLKVYPGDTVAPHFISRCKWFMHTPPPANWDGVWRG